MINPFQSNTQLIRIQNFLVLYYNKLLIKLIISFQLGVSIFVTNWIRDILLNDTVL